MKNPWQVEFNLLKSQLSSKKCGMRWIFLRLSLPQLDFCMASLPFWPRIAGTSDPTEA